MTLEERITLLGDRVVIKLERQKEHSVTDGGIIMPHTELVESDSGTKMNTRVSDKKHLPIGEVILISSKASEALPEISIGDTVFVASHALNNTNHFYPNRDRLVQEFEGYICIPHILIEAKLKNERPN